MSLKFATIKSTTNLQFSLGLFVIAKKVQFVVVKVSRNRDKTAPAPDLIGRLNSAPLKHDGAGCSSQDPLPSHPNTSHPDHHN